MKLSLTSALIIQRDATDLKSLVFDFVPK